MALCNCVMRAYQLNMEEHLCNDTNDVGSTPTQAVYTQLEHLKLIPCTLLYVTLKYLLVKFHQKSSMTSIPGPLDYSTFSSFLAFRIRVPINLGLRWMVCHKTQFFWTYLDHSHLTIIGSSFSCCSPRPTTISTSHKLP